MLYILQTLPGLAELAWREAETMLPLSGDEKLKHVATHMVPGRNDLLVCQYDGDPKALLRLRLSEDAFVVAARGFSIAPNERGLRQSYAAVKNAADVARALKAWQRTTGSKRPPATYRVVTREVGTHDFYRRDVGKAVADAIGDGWPGRLRRVEEDADLEVWASLLDNELLCAVRLSDADMRQRGKLRHLPASLRPALAAAMVHLTAPSPTDVFLDPMAGAGTIVVERAAAGPFAALYGGDINNPAVQAMRENTSKLKGRVVIQRWDARKLPMDDGSVDKIAVNLPFGDKIDAGEDLPDLYRDVLRQFARVLKPGGRMVVLVGDWRLLYDARAAAARELRTGPRHRVEVLGKVAWMCEFIRLAGKATPLPRRREDEEDDTFNESY
ncbi:MAG: RNA methyltransferase [Chloroflexaceae bacterium]|jgi:SAM-dependent methyltransferase|nr:RNA methyltransferase [Chloroflexaceae bacterium]